MNDVHLLVSEKKVTINGVDFYVVDMSPSYGVCTASTDFFAHGEPVTSDFVRGRQEQIDAEMALRLQREMAREAYGGDFPVFEPQVRQRDLDQVTLAIRSRLQQVIRTLPEGDPQRMALTNMDRRLGAVGSAGLLQLIREAQEGDLDFGPGPDAASSSQIDQLPTSVFLSASAPADEEQLSCRICLSDYEDHDILRTLPCFHRFHRDCIDKWLVRDKKCPICKTAISS